MTYSEPRKAYGVLLRLNSSAAKYISNVAIAQALEAGAREKQNTHKHTHAPRGFAPTITAHVK